MTIPADIRPNLAVNGWSLLALLTVALGAVFADGLVNMGKAWLTGEYSHGSMIPIVAIWMAMLRQDELARMTIRGRWWGVGAIVAGLLLAFVGEIATLFALIQYAFLLVIVGLAITAFGTSGLRVLWGPLAYLVFMIPLPDLIQLNLSNQLQLISSHVGVAMLRLADIPVFLDGNIIDLGAYKLQVAEACSGLRYLFPLISFGFLCALIYQGPTWHRVILFLSTIPIAVLMNSFRVGVIGLLVNVWGTATAEGFIHYFEGWVVFLICLTVLFVEAAILMRISRSELTLAEAFAMDLPDPKPLLRLMREGLVPVAVLVGTGLCVVAAIGSAFLGQRAEIVPARQSLLTFPLMLDGWRGQDTGLEAEIVGALRVSDYLNADYVNAETGEVVNFYVAYYESQRKGASVHSPRACIPGGGWEIERIEPVNVVPPGASPMTVQRLIIAKGANRQLVYYWFQQRGRRLTNEFEVKWRIFTDAIFLNRTDGALVRLVTPVKPGETLDQADARLTRFLGLVEPPLHDYIPD